MKIPIRIILTGLFAIAVAVAGQAQVVVMQPLTSFGPNGDGSLRPGDVLCLTSAGQLQRGMAYNRTTGHLLVVDRATNSSVNYLVYILDGATGANLATLANISPLAGGNAAYTLNLIGVADDGAIYAANLSNATGGNPQIRLYRWASESDPSPAIVSPTFDFPGDDPSSGATAASEKRWGDTMTVRGSGLNTQILLANRGTLAALYTPDDGNFTHFTPKTLTTDVATGKLGYGLTFGGGATFWGTSGAFGNGPLLHLSFNAGAGTATTLTNIPSTRVPGTLTPILVMPSSNLLAGITMVPGADVVRLYDITNTNSPALLDRKSFVTVSNNAAFGGSLALGTNGVLYALDSDNGIMAFKLTTVGSNPLPPVFFLNPASRSAVVGTNVTLTSGADSSLPVSYQWRFFGTNFNSSATNAFLTLTNVQLTNSGDYTVVASTTSDSVTSSVAVLNVTTNTSGTVTWNLPVGDTWDSTASWNPAVVPNGTGASAAFNNAASASNPAQTANRTITADAGQTVGSITFNNDAANTFTTSITVGSSGSLSFDETDAGPATITVPAVSGTGNFTISAPITLTDDLVATVNNITASSTAGALNLTATITGPGGFTKLGGGLCTFGTGAKTYTGPTVLSGGRMRMSLAAGPSATSSFTINSGAMLEPISNGTYSFGSGPLNLNGTGNPANTGVIRPDRVTDVGGRVLTISNPVVLQSDSLLHSQTIVGTSNPNAITTGSITLANVVSGPGNLAFTAPSHNQELGTLILNGANTYSGGTLVHGGTVVVGGFPDASLGTGNVVVESAHAVFAGASAKLSIQTGVLNAIADTATLSLAGGNVAGTADDGFVELQSGVEETVGGLKLGGVSQGAGTYGSTASSATFQNNEYFSGSGIVTVVPPPVPPSLNILLSKPNVILSWATNNADGYNLVSNANVITPRSNWTAVANSVVVVGTNKTVTVNVGSGNRFFCLRKQIP